MPKQKVLTAEQYRACWKDRIDQEKEHLAEAQAEEDARQAKRKAAIAAKEALAGEG